MKCNRHTRSLRLALFTSLGLIPLGCTETEPQSRGPSDVVVSGGPDAAAHPDQQQRDGGFQVRPTLAACGASNPVPAEDIGTRVTGHSLVRTPGIATGIYRCDSGLLHRPQPITCSSGLPRPLPPTSDAGADAAGASEDAGGALSQVDYLYQEALGGWFPPYDAECRADSECTQRPLGYCAPAYVGGPGGYNTRCQYGCLQDADCGDGLLCECGDPVGRCVQAECRSDSECGGDAKCAAWFTPVTCSQGQAYACQSAKDSCITSADCGQNEFCSGEGGTRTCVFGVAGGCGRPFLVEGEARVGALRGAGDWITDLPATAGEDLSAAERVLAGEHWARSALLEHASIAAFARFTLQLLHLGAPCELVQQSQRAMLDETAHTQACFTLASRYLQTPLGPGRLPMQSALDENELEQIVVLAFREGCVGETVATLEARAARDEALDPDVQVVLDQIAEDELRHAELAWHFVRWALGQKPELRQLLSSEVARFELELRAPLAAADSRELPEHGVLSAQRQERLRRAALANVVLPCARELLRSQPDVAPRYNLPEQEARPAHV